MSSTFERYARRLEAHRLVETGVVSADGLLVVVRELDDAVAGVEGHGFVSTPFAPAPALAAAAGIGGVELWVKDETGNVSGSHKARHLFGVALAHRLAEVVGAGDDGAGDRHAGGSPFAIASCGNAALAAAVVARAVGRPLDVYVPTWANDAVVARITELGGRVVRCERRPGVLGDPAHHAMLAAIEAGAVPFSCQGTETPTAIDGGRTLAWEMVDSLIEHDGGPAARLDRLFVQVGGGALATAVVAGLAASAARGDLARLPAVHAVQPEGNHPLVRAWDRLASELLEGPAPASNGERASAAEGLGPMSGGPLRAVVRRLRDSPQRYMQAWEREPVSYATGILDDVTYDWIDIVEAMLASGGWPVIASEDDFRSAHRLAHVHTGIGVCPTGASGLGGLIALTTACGDAAVAGVSPGERVAVLFTGRMRPGDPDPLVSGD